MPSRKQLLATLHTFLSKKHFELLQKQNDMKALLKISVNSSDR